MLYLVGVKKWISTIFLERREEGGGLMDSLTYLYGELEKRKLSRKQQYFLAKRIDEVCCLLEKEYGTIVSNYSNVRENMRLFKPKPRLRTISSSREFGKILQELRVVESLTSKETFAFSDYQSFIKSLNYISLYCFIENKDVIIEKTQFKTLLKHGESFELNPKNKQVRTFKKSQKKKTSTTSSGKLEIETYFNWSYKEVRYDWHQSFLRNQGMECSSQNQFFTIKTLIQKLCKYLISTPHHSIESTSFIALEPTAILVKYLTFGEAGALINTLEKGVEILGSDEFKKSRSVHPYEKEVFLLLEQFVPLLKEFQNSIVINRQNKTVISLSHLVNLKYEIERIKRRNETFIIGDLPFTDNLALNSWLTTKLVPEFKKRSRIEEVDLKVFRKKNEPLFQKIEILQEWFLKGLTEHHLELYAAVQALKIENQLSLKKEEFVFKPNKTFKPLKQVEKILLALNFCLENEALKEELNEDPEMLEALQHYYVFNEKSFLTEIFLKKHGTNRLSRIPSEQLVSEIQKYFPMELSEAESMELLNQTLPFLRNVYQDFEGNLVNLDDSLELVKPSLYWHSGRYSLHILNAPFIAREDKLPFILTCLNPKDEDAYSYLLVERKSFVYQLIRHVISQEGYHERTN